MAYSYNIEEDYYSIDQDSLLNPEEEIIKRRCVFIGSLNSLGDVTIKDFLDLSITIDNGRVLGNLIILNSVIHHFVISGLELNGHLKFTIDTSMLNFENLTITDPRNVEETQTGKQIEYGVYLGLLRIDHLVLLEDFNFILNSVSVDSMIFTGCRFGGNFTIFQNCSVAKQFIFQKAADSNVNSLILKKLQFGYRNNQRFDIEGDVKLSHVTIGDLNIDQVGFSGKFSLRSSEVKKSAFLVNSSFKALADFYGSKFHQPLNFFKCDFHGVTVFSDATFKNNLLFTFSEFRNHLIFRGTKFFNGKKLGGARKPGLDLSTAILPEKVYFQYVELKNFKCFKGEINDAARHEHLKDEEIGKAFGITYRNRRDTFRIIKKYAKDNDDLYEYNHFGYLEARASTTMFRRQFWMPWRENWKWPVQNYLIHSLNRWSNLHKSSWVYATVFIFFVAYGFTWAMIHYSKGSSLTGLESFKAVWTEIDLLLSTANPLRRDKVLSIDSGFKISRTVEFLDFFSRIFVGYGYYQFVQAFRRFK